MSLQSIRSVFNLQKHVLRKEEKSCLEKVLEKVKLNISKKCLEINHEKNCSLILIEVKMLRHKFYTNSDFLKSKFILKYCLLAFIFI
jgi:hypothetical protein